MKVRREHGSLGQFDVFVDGEVIAGRGRAKEGGFMQRLLSGGWPDAEDVIAKIEAIQKQRAKT